MAMILNLVRFAHTFYKSIGLIVRWSEIELRESA